VQQQAHGVVACLAMSTAPASSQQPNPVAIFEALNAYQRSFALKAAIQLDIFTEIARGADTVASIAKATGASERGVRILCDYLVIFEFLTKAAERYSLPLNSATFLNRESPAYFGIVSEFMLDPRIVEPFLHLSDVVKTGRTTLSDAGTVSHDNPIWIDFAKQMAPMAHPSAVEIAEMFAGTDTLRVLDIAAGHGLFGISIAERNPNAQITALDWSSVLAVAAENASKAGVAERHTLLAGDAFNVDLGGPYDLVLVTNFLHHFDPATCEQLLSRINAVLAPGGRCVNLDFIIEEDRVSPPTSASFAMTMLGTTVAGNVYTFAEYETMFRNAGFASSELRRLTRSPQAITISRKS
jgi:2-polyprenyl-3-methyl-5-hydroxy-6-metoxy-1,4-benzoquinol methylase